MWCQRAEEYDRKRELGVIKEPCLFLSKLSHSLHIDDFILGCGWRNNEKAGGEEY